MISISEFWIRGFSVIFSVLAVPLFYYLAKKLFDKQVAVLATLLLQFNFFYIFNAQNGRSYSLLLFLILASSLLFLKYVKSSTNKNKYFFSMITALAIYTHVYAGFLLIGQMIFLAFKERSAVLSKMISIGFIQLGLLLPFLISPAFRGDQVGWLDKPSLYAPIGIFSLFAGDYLPLLIVYGLLVLFLARILLDRKNLTDSLKFCFWLVVSPVVLALTISFILKPIYQSIYLFVSLPYFLILMGYAISKIKLLVLRYGVLILIIMFSLFRLIGWYFEVPQVGVFIENRKEEWRELTDDIVVMSKPTDGMIFFPYNVDVSVDAYLLNYPSIRMTTIQLTSEYFSLGGNTKVLPYPDKDRLEYALKYPRIWYIEGGIDTHKDLNIMQKLAIKQFMEEYYIPIGHKEYFDVNWILYQKKEVK
jgi:hypothetical protein